MAIMIGSRREPFWDEYLLDTEKTSASLRVGRPIRRGVVMTCDEPWEGDGCDFFNLIRDGDRYRLYYLGWEIFPSPDKKHTEKGIRVCYAESRDGLGFTKPSLGIVSFDGSTDNNILFTPSTLFPSSGSGIDNFFVMIDGNPSPTVKGRYKAVAREEIPAEGGNRRPALTFFASDDGLHFTRVNTVLFDDGLDTLNTVHYNAALGKYLCYCRGFHDPIVDGVPQKSDLAAGYDVRVRDIRVMESADFLSWSEPVRLDYGDSPDDPLYTNVVSVYERAPHILTGFPSRYIERRTWTPTFDRLGGVEKRRERSAICPRFGLTITDCVFMSSRDGYHFRRFDEAFGRNEPENGYNWVYGDLYPCVGMTETPSDIPGADNELSFYCFERHWSGTPAQLARYSVRADGFASLHADFAPVKAVTKPLVFEGNTLLLNFATSARGYIVVTVRDVSTGEEIHSYEIFGNKVDRIVDFEAASGGIGSLADFSGKEVQITFEMSDADLYAMKFTNE